MIGDAERHGRGHAQRLMHTAEIVVHDIERDGGAVIDEILAETVRQSREPALAHAKRQILPFDIAGADMRGRTDYSVLGYAYYYARAVAPRRFRCGRCRVPLFDDAKLALLAKGIGDGPRIGSEAVRADFRGADDALAQIIHKGASRLCGTLADAIGQDGLRGASKGNERVLIANHIGIVGGDAALLLADKSPDFVKLDAVHLQIAHKRAVQFGAAFADTDAKAHDGVAVNAGQALGRADADALSESGDDVSLLVAGKNVCHGANPYAAGGPGGSRKVQTFPLYCGERSETRGPNPGLMIRVRRCSSSLGPNFRAFPVYDSNVGFLTCKGGCPTTRRTGNILSFQRPV